MITGTKLDATVRNEVGTRSSRRLRSGGNIPAVLYGKNITPQSVAVDSSKLRSILRSKTGENTLIELNVNGKAHTVLARGVQRHPIKLNILSVDFLCVDPDDIVSVEVPVILVGDPKEVTIRGARVEQQIFRVHLKSPVKSVPVELEVDISSMTLSSTIKAGDLNLPTGVSLEVDPNVIVAVPQLPRGTKQSQLLEATGSSAE